MCARPRGCGHLSVFLLSACQPLLTQVWGEKPTWPPPISVAHRHGRGLLSQQRPLRRSWPGKSHLPGTGEGAVLRAPREGQLVQPGQALAGLPGSGSHAFPQGEPLTQVLRTFPLILVPRMQRIQSCIFFIQKVLSTCCVAVVLGYVPIPLWGDGIRQ